MHLTISILRVFATDGTTDGEYTSYAVLVDPQAIEDCIAAEEKRLEVPIVPLHHYDRGDFGILLYHQEYGRHGTN